MFIITNPRQIPLNIWSSLKSVSGSHFWPSFITFPVTYIPNITQKNVCVKFKDFGSGYWIRFHLERKVCFRTASVEKLYGFLNTSWTCGCSLVAHQTSGAEVPGSNPTSPTISVVDLNTLNLDLDPGFWPNLDPDPWQHCTQWSWCAAGSLCRNVENLRVERETYPCGTKRSTL